MSDDTRDDPLEGTHPTAIVGMASGIMSIAGGVFCCLDPRLAGIIHALLGLIALGAGTTTWLKVRRGQLEEHNLFQVRFAMVLGGIGLIAGISWLIWWYLHPDGH